MRALLSATRFISPCKSRSRDPMEKSSLRITRMLSVLSRNLE